MLRWRYYLVGIIDRMHTPCVCDRTRLGDWRENGDIVSETVVLLPRKSRCSEELSLDGRLKESSDGHVVRECAVYDASLMRARGA